MKEFMDAMGAAVLTNNNDLLDKLESFLSNPLQPFDYSLLQQCYNEIVTLHKAKDALFSTINAVGDINIKLEKELERWKNNAIDFAQMSRKISTDLVAERNKIYQIADMYYLCVDGADEEFKKYKINPLRPNYSQQKDQADLLTRLYWAIEDADENWELIDEAAQEIDLLIDAGNRLVEATNSGGLDEAIDNWISLVGENYV